MARDTWDPDGSRAVPVDELLRVVAENLPVDGVTISGGDPLDQEAELVRLLDGLRRIIAPSGGDLLCYTGRSPRVVRARYAHVLALVDAMVAGPYDRRRPSQSSLMGSANQEVITTTPLGEARYAGRPPRRTLQVDIRDDRLYTIGVPGVGDLAAIEAAASATGLAIQGASWRDAGTDCHEPG